MTTTITTEQFEAALNWLNCPNSVPAADRFHELCDWDWAEPVEVIRLAIAQRDARIAELEAAIDPRQEHDGRCGTCSGRGWVCVQTACFPNPAVYNECSDCNGTGKKGAELLGREDFDLAKKYRGM